jgi:hypothetical protein
MKMMNAQKMVAHHKTKIAVVVNVMMKVHHERDKTGLQETVDLLRIALLKTTDVTAIGAMTKMIKDDS